ncbi:TIGR03773 family transporter-associated surface protein [Streptomyces sp. NPDC050560]|uniref:TIGR03773 family transporter-associated surface protein n=1 Tax=Streptomyces sp. NPDC050560 TaxID=3365630 RepID=UPI0037B353E1
MPETTRPHRRALAGAIGSLALAAGLVPVAHADPAGQNAREPSAPTARVVFALDGTGLALRLDTERPAGGTADLALGPGARTAVPDDAPYPFRDGTDGHVWMLGGGTPRERGDGGGLAEWDTGAIPDGGLTGGVRWSLTGVEGPGEVAVVAPSDASGGADEPRVFFDSSDGVPDGRTLPAAENGTLAWMFTAPGEYRLTSRASARLASGRTVHTTATWTVRVADEGQSAPSTPDTPPAETPGTTAPRPPADTARRPGATAPAPSPSTRTSTARTAADTAVENRRVVIDDGHVDAVAAKMVGGRLRTLLKDSRDPAHIVWREPSSVVLHVNPAAREKVPAGAAYSFLGKPGSAFWLIPQVQKQGVVWAGWNTEEVTGADFKGPLDLKLTEVSGPGTVAVWETAGLGDADVLYDSSDGLPDSHKVELGVHAHANWGFGKEGVYRVTFQFSGTTAAGKTASDTRTYTFAVGDVDTSEVDPGGGAGDGGSNGAGGSGSSDGSPGTGGSRGSGGSGDGGSLAHTGASATGSLAWGSLALVLGGGAAVAAARRRAHRGTPSAS